jgi:ABC-type glycerol-3-phosphate transport system substrate-binding protein
MANGDICAFITPDWRISYIRSYAPELAGRVRFRPLPRFDPDDPPTSTWGGTMAGIPRNVKDVEASWALLKTLYFGAPALEARLRHTVILPASRSDWADPVFHEPDPFFGGQYINRELIELAEQIPPRYVTPFTTLGTQALSTVLHRAISHVESQGPEGLEAACQRWLDQAAADLERRIEFGKFE